MSLFALKAAIHFRVGPALPVLPSCPLQLNSTFNGDNIISFSGIDVEIEPSKTYRFSLMLLLDRGIPEATCIVVNVLAPVW